MLIDQKIIIKWHNRYKKYYESKGYKFTKAGENFEINVGDLQEGSEVSVKYICDYCGELREKPYKNLIKPRRKNGKDCCDNIKCVNEKRKEARERKGVNKEESFGHLYPQIAEQWHSTKNLKTPFEYTPYSQQKVWWTCGEGHSWEASIGKRTRAGRGCPYCAGMKVSPTNSLAAKRPDIAIDWNFSKNKPLTPRQVTFSSGKKVWWECEHGHEWDAKISNRVRGTGCPICSESKGEAAISLWLDEQGIEYEREYSFNGLTGVGGELLRFDFVVKNKCEIVALIEYDGEFHFKKVYEGDGFEKIREHDLRKNKYCVDKGFLLIRIPYTRFDEIGDILENKILSLLPYSEGEKLA